MCLLSFLVSLIVVSHEMKHDVIINSSNVFFILIGLWLVIQVKEDRFKKNFLTTNLIDG